MSEVLEQEPQQSEGPEETPVAEQSAARSWRLWLIAFLMVLIAGGIVAKLVSLYVVDQAFLQSQGDARTLRTTLIPVHRGIIRDRNGEPLAVSAPVATVWANPKEADLQHEKLGALAKLLEMPRADLIQRLKKFRSKQFLYLKRQLTPELASKVDALSIPGINVDREYKRYYPAAEVATHLVGFTNVDGEGQEGLELAFNDWLRGEPGKKLVLKDRLGRTIKHIKSLEEPDPGEDLQLSIDLRVQYMAYRELKAAVRSHRADGGSVVVLDARSGEVLAMVNRPSYNPNDRGRLKPAALRNRAMTDVFEPGSPMKPITVAAALMSGKYTPESVIDTAPGYIRIKGHTIRDHRNYGDLDLERVIQKSSNVGATKLALSMHFDSVRRLMANMGLGESTGSGFPGERTGTLPYIAEKRVVERATMSYGYGLAITPLQLARAYTAFANGGVIRSVSLLKQEQPDEGLRVMPEEVSRQVLEMMESVISTAGSGRRAAVDGYRVAGKTGTVHKLGRAGYIDDQYVSVFAGVAPVQNPEIVVVVMVDNPKGQEYYGGEVAAPVFSRVTGGALRLLNVAPDNWPQEEGKVASR